MVSLFIASYIYIFILMSIYIHTVYIHTVHTDSNFILSGYSADLVLIIIRIKCLIAASMASDFVEPQFYSHTPDMIVTDPALVLFSKYFYTKIY